MNAIFSTVRRDRKPVILSSVKYGAKLSTSARSTRRSLSPLAQFCLQMLAALGLGLGILALFVFTSEAVAGTALGLLLVVFLAAIKKGGLL